MKRPLRDAYDVVDLVDVVDVAVAYPATDEPKRKNVPFQREPCLLNYSRPPVVR